jgi:hypothetical protein
MGHYATEQCSAVRNRTKHSVKLCTISEHAERNCPHSLSMLNETVCSTLLSFRELINQSRFLVIRL